MINDTPRNTINLLLQAFNSQDANKASLLYEDDAIFYIQPEITIHGRNSIATALADMFAVKPKITTVKSCFIEKGDVALYMAEWEMSYTNPEGEISVEHEISADILQKDKNGFWLIAVDNPWGSKVL